jgi:hypothetical protein
MNLNVQLLPDEETAQIKLGNIPFQMKAYQIDAFIAGLADIRSKMKPAVPEKFPQGKPTHRHDATNYFFGIDAVTVMPVLSIRSPAFGWLSFAFSFEEAENLGGQMQAARNHPLVPSMSKRN